MKSPLSFRRTVVIVLVVVGLVLLFGCQPAAEEEEPVEVAPVEEAPRIIVDGISQEPNLLNPILAPSMAFQVGVNRTLFPELFTIKPDGSIVPYLAETVPTVENGLITDGGRTYTVPLKKDVTWSDGVAFTAADVKFSWEMIMHPDVVPRTLMGFDRIVSVETPDDHTVVFHLEDVYPGFLSVWANPSIIPKHVWADVPTAEIMESPMNVEPEVTLGPFTFKDWVAGDHIRVVRDPNYFGEPARVDEIVFRIIEDQNALLVAILRGDINIWYYAPVTHVPTIEADPDTELVWMDVPTWWEHATFNVRNPMLEDVRVRQALNYAVDQELLIESVWTGYAVPQNSPLPMGSWAYHDELAHYPHDPERAGELLEEAGWVMGSDGRRRKDGEVLQLVYSTTAGNPWREQTQRIVQDLCSQVGVDLVIRNVDAATFFGTLMPGQLTGPEGGWDLGEYQTVASWDPAVGLDTLFHSRMAEGPVGNRGGYVNPTVDALLDQVSVMVDPDERMPLFRELATILKDDAPVLYLYTPLEANATRGVRGFVPNPWTHWTWNVQEWELID